VLLLTSLSLASLATSLLVAPLLALRSSPYLSSHTPKKEEVAFVRRWIKERFKDE
jgi:hypothetical protein